MTHEGAVLVCGVEGADAAMPCASFTHQLPQTRDRLSNHPFVMLCYLVFQIYRAQACIHFIFNLSSRRRFSDVCKSRAKGPQAREDSASCVGAGGRGELIGGGGDVDALGGKRPGASLVGCMALLAKAS
jgi:hypothetical protein